MGASISVTNLDKKEGYNPTNLSVDIKPTDELEIVLKNQETRDQFKEFILFDWNPKSNFEACFNYKSRNLSINCIDLWVDIQNFAEIIPSSFQTYRACYIFEKYLMHGATRFVSYYYYYYHLAIMNLFFPGRFFILN